MFIDFAKIRVTGGAGGAGACAFRREKGVPRGGPSGGDGGSGGAVILRADPTLDTLLDYSYREHYRAERAGHGEGSNRHGADGDDLILPVPLGTVVHLVLTSENRDRVEVDSTPLAGTLEASTATASLTIPPGFSRFTVQASWTP